ncbi:DNA cytosine methyltransferase [Archangium gephyra]|uniref:DNA cytosine methyltransferase n=1 Tax=Archangium gephyra TaxID=48 RepID=UPI003B7D3BC1
MRKGNRERPSAAGADRPLTVVDLFCGAGGFTLGLERAGFHVLCGVDSWNLAAETYARNFKHPIVCADISQMSAGELLRRADVEGSPVDLVVGGPPCQGFSVQRIGSDDDARNSLVLEFVRMVRELRPRLFIMENVPGLVGKRGHALFESFLEAVDAAGFDAEAHLVNAADHGVPQVRRRVVVLGRRRADTAPFLLPGASFKEEEYRTVWDAIGDLPAPTAPDSALLPDPLHRQTRLSELNRQRLRHIPPGGGMEDLPVHLRVDCHKAGADRIGHRYVYGRLAPDRPASTITARFDSFTRGRFAHPFEDRNITLREGARLQTFPDGFLFAGNQEDVAAQIGNAVPPLLAEVLGRAAAACLAASPLGESSTGTRRKSAHGSRQMLLFQQERGG